MFKKKPQFAKSGHSGKVTPRSERAMFRETTRNPSGTSQTLQLSVSMLMLRLNVKIHNSKIRKTEQIQLILKGFQTPNLSKKNMENGLD